MKMIKSRRFNLDKMNNIENSKISIVIISTILLLLAPVLNLINFNMASIVFCVYAVTVYIYLYRLTGNPVDLMAVFSGVWFATIGLANLKLLDYQNIWVYSTWIYLAIGFLCLSMGILIGNRLKIVSKIEKKMFSTVKNEQWRFTKERIFPISITLCILSVIGFCITVKMVGFIPFFVTNDPNAYAKFYTKFNLIYIMSTMVAPISIYGIKNCNYGMIKKVLLILTIVINNIMLPLLAANRGIFIFTILSTAVYACILYSKKLTVFIFFIVISVAGYAVGSYARHFNAVGFTQIPNEQEDEEDEEVAYQEGMLTDEIKDNRLIALNGTTSMIYTYLIVGHENFNLAVKDGETLTYGIRQLNGFYLNFLSKWFGNYAEDFELHFVNPTLNTNNFLGSSFYDLRWLGIILFITLQGIAFGCIESYCLSKASPLVMILHGNNAAVVFLTFFEAMITHNSYYLYLFMIIILSILLCFKPKRKGINNDK